MVVKSFKETHLLSPTIAA